jgi:hypothetical protein
MAKKKPTKKKQVKKSAKKQKKKSTKKGVVKRAKKKTAKATKPITHEEPVGLGRGEPQGQEDENHEPGFYQEDIGTNVATGKDDESENIDDEPV